MRTEQERQGDYPSIRLHTRRGSRTSSRGSRSRPVVDLMVVPSLAGSAKRSGKFARVGR